MYSSVGADGTRHVLGARLHVEASWDASCTNWGAAFDNALAKSDSSHRDDTEPCKQKPFELQIACSSKCSHTARPWRGSLVVDVVAEQLGPLTITATSRRIDSGETLTKTLPGVLVVLPDRLELRCAAGEGSSETRPCGPEGVTAQKPLVTPVVHVGDHTEPTTALLVNGKPSPAELGAALSLADLYPEAWDGAAIKPGSYPVTLTVGTVTTTWQVVAR